MHLPYEWMEIIVYWFINQFIYWFINLSINQQIYKWI